MFQKIVLLQYVPVGPPTAPAAKGAYGVVTLEPAGTIFDNLEHLGLQRPISATYPLSFEVLKQAYGFVLYRTKIQKHYRDPSVLSVPGLRDRAIIFVDQVWFVWVWHFGKMTDYFMWIQ